MLFKPLNLNFPLRAFNVIKGLEAYEHAIWNIIMSSQGCLCCHSHVNTIQDQPVIEMLY